MDAVGTPVFCDPDVYPIARQGGEQANAIANYPQIRAQADLYAAIIAHEHLPSGDLNDAQKLTIYRAFKLSRALTLTRNGDDYAFDFRARSQSQASIQLTTGTVTIDGVVTVTSKTASAPPPCPICLAASTLIETPSGVVRGVDVQPGMLVWTMSASGTRVAAPGVEVGSTPVPAGHLMGQLKLAAGRPLGALSVGDRLDGSTVTQWELVPYAGDRTYDLLPAGPTGTYWANGILLSSTLTTLLPPPPTAGGR